MEEKISQFREAQRLHKGGLDLKQACSQVKMGYSAYYYWKSKLGKQKAPKALKKSKLTVLDIPTVQTVDRAFIVLRQPFRTR